MALDFPDAPVADEVFVTPKTNFIWLIAPDRWARQRAAPLAVTLTMLNPDTAVIGERPTITLIGTGFTVASTVNFGADVITPTFNSSTRLTIRPLTHSTPETVQVSVTDAGNTSNALPFIYTPLKPFLTDLVPDASMINEATPVIVVGSNFLPNSVAHFDGIAAPTTYISATELETVAPASAIAVPVMTTVVTDTVASNPFPFKYLRAVIVQLWPGILDNTIDNQVVRIEGKGFVPTAVAEVAGVSQATVFVSDTELTMTVVLGGWAYTTTAVFQDGYYTNAVPTNFVTALPDITQLTPNQVPINNATTVVSVLGSNLWTSTGRESEAVLDGVVLPTTMISQTELQFTAPSRSTPGTAQVAVLTNGTLSPTTLPLTYV